MAKANRSREETGDTRQVRVFEDLGDMISWIVRVEGGTTANLLDPMIRDQIEARYEAHRAVIDKIKAAEDELRRVELEAKQQPAVTPKKKPK